MNIGNKFFGGLIDCSVAKNGLRKFFHSTSKLPMKAKKPNTANFYTSTLIARTMYSSMTKNKSVDP